MLIKTFLHAFGEAIPLTAAGYEKDAVGLQVGYDDGETLRRVLVVYEVTDEIISEAISIGANLIIAYHPLIFPNISSITDSTRTGLLVRRLIVSKIALYVVHTAFDAQPEFGTSALMARALGLKNIQTLAPLTDRLEKIVVFVPNADPTIVEQVQAAMWQAGAGNISNYDECSFSVEGYGTFRGNEQSHPVIGQPLVRETASEVRIEMICERWKSQYVIKAMIGAHPYEEVAYDRYPVTNSHPKYGMGSIGEFAQPMPIAQFLEFTGKIFGSEVLRYSNSNKTVISRVAMLGGSGMDYYSMARNAGADAFLSGDIRYHDFYKAEHDRLLLVDVGHAETECFVVRGMLEQALRVWNVVDLHNTDQHSIVVGSGIRPNAVQYYIRKSEEL